MSHYETMLQGVPWVESPFFEQIIAEKKLTNSERSAAISLHNDGFAVIDFPDDELDSRIERITANLSKLVDWDHWRANCAHGGSVRFPDLWKENPDVRAIATNERIISLISLLYGRRAFPFQTLNFAVGTQQHYHTDAIHFNSVPDRFMCGVWLAMEDIDEDNGPLVYYPGSHKWPLYSNEEIGHLVTEQKAYGQPTFEPLWRALVETQGVPVQRFFAKKGQALIWASNLLHGGDQHHSIDRTRWSQVTHYYFEDCAYYTPSASLPALGTFAYRDIVDISTGKPVPNQLMGKEVARADIDRLAFKPAADNVPFDAAAYLAANPDVARAGADPRMHYEVYGRAEGRPLRPA